jgi:predicted TPR repeat methyltransferase
MPKDIFRKFWESKESPLHGKDEIDYFKKLSSEINYILIDNNYNIAGNVFEIGCGDGANFEYLNINKEKYEGVDFSEPMIELFKKKHPNVNAKVGSEQALYNSNKKYKLIFGIGVHQFFSPCSLDVYLVNSLKKLEKDGLLILGFLLSNEQKLNFYLGRHFSNSQSLSSLSYLKGIINYLKLSKNSKLFGFWFSVNFFRKLEKKHNCNVQIYNSMLRPYRFSVCLKKNS